MNLFEEAEILAQVNKKIKSRAFDSTCDYKPMDDNLQLSSYVEYGYIKGQQELLELLLEHKVVNHYQLKTFFENEF